MFIYCVFHSKNKNIYISSVHIIFISKKINVIILLIANKVKNNLTKTDIKRFNDENPTLNINILIFFITGL